MYISLTQEDVDSKLKALNCWESQKRCRPYFFSIDRFKAKLISRGTEVRESYSEAFEVIGKIKKYININKSYKYMNINVY